MYHQLKLIEARLARRRDRLGPEHPDTLTSMNDLALAWMEDGHLREALGLLEEAFRSARTKLGRHHAVALTSSVNLAAACRAAGRLHQARRLLREVLSSRQSMPDPDRGEVAGNLLDLAAVLVELREFAEAEVMLREWLRGSAECDPAGPQWHEAQRLLGRSLFGRGRFSEAEAAARAAWAVPARQTEDSWQAFDAQSLLGACLARQERYDQAGPHLLAGYEGIGQSHIRPRAHGSSPIRDALGRLIDFFKVIGDSARVAEFSEKLAGFVEAELRTLCDRNLGAIEQWLQSRGWAEPSQLAGRFQSHLVQRLRRHRHDDGRPRIDEGRLLFFIMSALRKFLRKEPRAPETGPPPDGTANGATAGPGTHREISPLDVEFALSIHCQVMETLRATARDATRFDALRRFILVEQPDSSYAETARVLGLAQGAIRIAVHRLRDDYFNAIRRELLAICHNGPCGCDYEFNLIMEALSQALAEGGTP